MRIRECMELGCDLTTCSNCPLCGTEGGYVDLDCPKCLACLEEKDIDVIPLMVR